MLWIRIYNWTQRTPMKLTSTGIWTCLAAAMTIFALPAVAQVPGSSHPLVGKIFDTRTGVLTELSDQALIPKLFPCGAITLLGEVHDNAEHHKMRGQLLQSEREEGGGMRHNCGSPAFVFEHLSVDQQATLEQFFKEPRRGSHGTDRMISSLFWRLDQTNSGWQLGLLRPLFQQAIRPGGRLVPGNPKTETTIKVAKQGINALEPVTVSAMALDKPLASDLQDDLLTELEASHCGLMPKSAFGNMAAAQRYRDAFMADVALKATEASGNVVMFAGNGHVRTDRGVPWYIQQRAPNQKVIAVAFVETEDGKTDPATYGPRDPAGKPAADYIAFALPAKREDPCAQMRSGMKK